MLVYRYIMLSLSCLDESNVTSEIIPFRIEIFLLSLEVILHAAEANHPCSNSEKKIPTTERRVLIERNKDSCTRIYKYDFDN